MRLWSLHPSYLDARGLVALWREALLAQAVLAGRTRGYRSHPQLERFRASSAPAAAMRSYLEEVYAEAQRRGYSFDATRIDGGRQPSAARSVHAASLEVSEGQLAYEWKLLKAKLELRSPERRRALERVEAPLPHPLFSLRQGPIEPWERPRQLS